MLFLCESVAKASLDFPSELRSAVYPTPLHLALPVCASQDRMRGLFSRFAPVTLVFPGDNYHWHLSLITVNMLALSALGWAKITWPNSRSSFSFYNRVGTTTRRRQIQAEIFFPIWVYVMKAQELKLPFSWEQLYPSLRDEKWIKLERDYVNSKYSNGMCY